MREISSQPRFVCKDGSIWLERGDGSGPQRVRAVWARPISGRGADISIIDERKREVLLLHDLSTLDAASRGCLEAELRSAYLMPKITRVNRTDARYGNRYWDVETDCGPRRFVIKDPAANVQWDNGDRMIIRDTLDNRYEIESLAALDAASRAAVEKIV